MFSAVIIQRLTRGHNFSPQLLRQRFHTAPLYPGEEPASTWAEIAKPLRRLPQLTTKAGNPLIARMIHREEERRFEALGIQKDRRGRC